MGDYRGEFVIVERLKQSRDVMCKVARSPIPLIQLFA